MGAVEDTASVDESHHQASEFPKDTEVVHGKEEIEKKKRTNFI